MSTPDSTPAVRLNPAEGLFVAEAVWQVPILADRYATKKKHGDADGYNTKDEIET